MNIKLISVALAFASLMVLPANALTRQEVWDALEGFECHGHSCSYEDTVSETIENPDIVTEVELPDIETIVELPDGTFETVVVEQSNISEDPGPDTVTVGCLRKTIFGNPIPEDRLSFFCTGNNSLSPLRGGGPAVNRIVTTVVDGGTTTVITDGGVEIVVTDGGTTVVETCVTTTATLSHQGHHHNSGWSIDYDESSSEGACD